jgi:F-type H+-transporting ATPase subunit epsilon
MMTVLAFGLARYRTTDDRWHFLAVPRGLLYSVDNNLYLSARRYIRDDDYAQISQALEEQLVTEEAALHRIKDRLHRLEV